MQVWKADKDVQATDEFPRAIAQAIDSSDLLLFLASRDSCNSAWCRSELRYAVDRKKKILPLRLEECELPLQVGDIHAINFHELSLQIWAALQAAGVRPRPVRSRNARCGRRELLFVGMALSSAGSLFAWRRARAQRAALNEAFQLVGGHAAAVLRSARDLQSAGKLYLREPPLNEQQLQEKWDDFSGAIANHEQTVARLRAARADMAEQRDGLTEREVALRLSDFIATIDSLQVLEQPRKPQGVSVDTAWSVIVQSTGKLEAELETQINRLQSQLVAYRNATIVELDGDLGVDLLA